VAYGDSRRGALIRTGLAAAALVLVVWALSSRRAGEDGGRGSDAPSGRGAFERADVTWLKAGQQGPGFRLEAFPAGGPVSLERFREELVVLNFWATWCPPCTAEMPTLEALWQTYRERGLVVIGVSVDRGAPRRILTAYVDQRRLTFPILLDPDLAASEAWRVTRLPTTFLLRPGGDVAGVAIGERRWNDPAMRALIETLLPAPRGGGATPVPRSGAVTAVPGA